MKIAFTMSIEHGSVIRFHTRSQAGIVYMLRSDNGEWKLLKSLKGPEPERKFIELPLRDQNSRISPPLALALLNNLLRSKGPKTWKELRDGIPKAETLTHDWILKQMRYIHDAVPGIFTTQRTAAGVQLTKFHLSADLAVDSESDSSPKTSGDFILNSMAEASNSITPVLHTLSLVRRPDGLLREVWGKNDRRNGETDFPALTGRGDAEVLRLLQLRCDVLQIPVNQSVPARDFKPSDMEQHSHFWIGSAFNEMHQAYSMLRNDGLWERAPECWLRGERGKGTKVEYPGAPSIYTNRREDDDEFALIRSVLYRGAHKKKIRLVLVAGTTTEATLWAGSLLLHDPSDDRRGALLRRAIGVVKDGSELHFESIFQTFPHEKLLWSSETRDFDPYTASSPSDGKKFRGGSHSTKKTKKIRRNRRENALAPASK